MFTPNSINNRQPRGQMQMPNKTPDLKSARPNVGPRMRQPMMNQNNSQGSDNDNSDLIHQTNPHMNAGAKNMGNAMKRNMDGQFGSEDGSQEEVQGQQPMYNYQQGMHHSPYQHPGYNYQMPPQVMRGGQGGYGMYSPYAPMMNQRPPMKQYQHPATYNYQGRGGYAGPMNMKGMPRPPPPPAEYYDEYKYGSADNEAPQMHGGHMENAQGFHAVRPVKSPKPMAMSQHPGYQYTNQHMSPMYQPVQHPGHYDPRSPYDYAPYKSKPGEIGMSPGQSPHYNYKPSGIPPYSYAGGQQFGKSQEQEEVNTVPVMGNIYREENQQAAGPKGKKAAMKPRPADDQGFNDSSKPAKVGKARQFAEDFDSNDLDN